MQVSKISVFVLMLSFATLATAQINVPPSNVRLAPPPPEERARQQRIINDRLGDKGEDGMIAGRPEGKWPIPPRSKPDGKPYSQKELDEIRKKTEPEASDVARFKSFLAQSKSGIFKLIPNYDCESNLVLRADDKCVDFVPGGWLYSLRMRSHLQLTQAEWDVFDISLTGDVMAVDGFLSQSVIVPIGDVPIEDVDLQSKGLKFLTEFVPKTKYAEAREQYREIGALIRSDGLVFAKRVRAAENMTYAARLIAFRTPDLIAQRFTSVGGKNAKYLMLNTYDKRCDIIVVMRVVGVGPDGSLTMLWRELSRKSAPKIVYAENEKIGDLK